MKRTRSVLVVVAGIMLVIAGLVAFVVWPRGTSDVTREDALEDFRERASTTVDGNPDETEGAGERPLAGVYEFSAQGEEVVKLGPLPAETRQLSEVVTAVVVHAGADCFEISINLFVEHTEDTRYCLDGAELVLDQHVKHQQVGALSPTATMTCDPAVLRHPDEPAPELVCSLDLSGGPMAIGAQLSGRAQTGEPGFVAVGGEDVAATPVTLDLVVSGDLSGTWRETTWWSEAGLPVRIERSLDLSGPATFQEDSVLTLRSLEPTT